MQTGAGRAGWRPDQYCWREADSCATGQDATGLRYCGSRGNGYQEAYSKVVDAANVESQRDVFNLAAYRDGLYIGGLDAQEAKTEHIAIGRWSGVQNRAAFSAGYLQGYSVMTDFENRSGHMLSAVQAMDK